MTKRIIALLCALILVFSVALLPASAESKKSYMLVDSADLLKDNEEAKLLKTLEEVSDKCECNVAVVTVSDLSDPDVECNRTTKDFADVSYEMLFGKNTDGVLLLVTLKNENGKREFYFSTSGKCIKRLSDSERESIFDDMQSDHNPDSKGYYDTLNAAALGLEKAIPPHVTVGQTLLAIVIGFGISLVIMLILKSKLKSVRMARGAVNYVRPGSMNVTAARDTYLYRTVSRTAKPKNNSSGSHTSSGGGIHGGGGREF